MVAHNNVIPNVHFHKNWQERVKTWFNQAGKKKSRRRARAVKAAKVFPRPVSGALRPVVRGQTNKYNVKQRLGRGFTFEELKEAGINRQLAQTIGIALDHRRRNRSEDSLAANVQRLKEYKSKLVLFPRNAKKPKAGDASEADQKAATQQTGTLFPVKKDAFAVTRMDVSEDMRKGSVFVKLRRTRADERLVGVREKRAIEKAAAEEAAGKKKK